MADHILEIGLLIFSVVIWVGWCSLNRDQIFSGSVPFSPVGQWSRSLARLSYFIGIPYLAIVVGAVSPRLLGLTGLEYFDFINGQAEFWGQLQQAIMLMLLSWLLDTRVLVPLGLAGLLFLFTVRPGLTRHEWPVSNPSTSFLNTVYESLHWAFYRAVFWAVTDDLYLGVVFGAGIVILEGGLGYIIQSPPLGWQQPFLMNLSILVLTATLFFYIQNLWLLVPIHVAMAALVRKPSGDQNVLIRNLTPGSPERTR